MSHPRSMVVAGLRPIGDFLPGVIASVLRARRRNRLARRQPAASPQSAMVRRARVCAVMPGDIALDATALRAIYEPPDQARLALSQACLRGIPAAGGPRKAPGRALDAFERVQARGRL